MLANYHSRAMSSPRFEPRRYSAEPQVFGKAKSIDWRSVTSDDEETQLVASQIQHEFAVAIQRAITASPYRTVEAYARATGADYQRLAKVLRGEAIMRLVDIAGAHRRLGIPVPNTREEPE